MQNELKKSRLFAEFTEDELETLAGIADKDTVMQGEYAFQEGEKGDCLIVVRTGTLVLSKKNESGMEQTLATIGSGSYVGEMALFDNAPRSASGKASERTDIFIIPYDKLIRMLDRNNSMAAKFYKALAHGIARRLHFMNQDMATLKSYLKER